MTSFDLEGTYGYIARTFLRGDFPVVKVESKTWQSTEISSVPGMSYSLEWPNYILHYPIPETVEDTKERIKPNLPWAEDHFQERVSGIPHNPPPSAAYWPYKKGDHKGHTDEMGRFSHTYPERFWPKGPMNEGRTYDPGQPQGIRFNYGDLDDVVQLLIKDPTTRQAYLPVWFPEDTGAAHGERVPCTLGYHFLYRDGKLNMTYLIRSCDFMRHFRDDIYLAMRLAQWVADKAFGDEGAVGLLCFHAMSLHIFEGDIPILRHKYGKD